MKSKTEKRVAQIAWVYFTLAWVSCWLMLAFIAVVSQNVTALMLWGLFTCWLLMRMGGTTWEVWHDEE